MQVFGTPGVNAPKYFGEKVSLRDRDEIPKGATGQLQRIGLAQKLGLG